MSMKSMWLLGWGWRVRGEAQTGGQAGDCGSSLASPQTRLSPWPPCPSLGPWPLEPCAPPPPWVSTASPEAWGSCLPTPPSTFCHQRLDLPFPEISVNTSACVWLCLASSCPDCSCDSCTWHTCSPSFPRRAASRSCHGRRQGPTSGRRRHGGRAAGPPREQSAAAPESTLAKCWPGR